MGADLVPGFHHGHGRFFGRGFLELEPVVFFEPELAFFAVEPLFFELAFFAVEPLFFELARAAAAFARAA